MWSISNNFSVRSLIIKKFPRSATDSRGGVKQSANVLEENDKNKISAPSRLSTLREESKNNVSVAVFH